MKKSDQVKRLILSNSNYIVLRHLLYFGNHKISLIRTFTQRGQLFQRIQAWHEAIFTTAYHNELWESMKSSPDRTFGYSKYFFSLAIVQDWILLCAVTDEIAVSDPLRLNEFKLPLYMCAHKQKDTAALQAIVFHDAFWK